MRPASIRFELEQEQEAYALVASFLLSSFFGHAFRSIDHCEHEQDRCILYFVLIQIRT